MSDDRKDPRTVRCHADVHSDSYRSFHSCMNKTKDPSGKCWRHR